MRHVAVAGAVFITIVVLRFLSADGFHNDQFMHMAWGRQVLAGEWPVRDFVDPGMPLTYLMSAAVDLIGGHRLLGEAILSIGFLGLGGAVTYLVAHQLSGSAALALWAVSIQVLLGPRLYSHPKIWIYAVALWVFLRFERQPGRRWGIALAAWTAVAFLMRHDHGIYVGAASAVLIVAAAVPGARTRSLATFAAAVLLWLLPWLLYVQLNGGVVPYLRQGAEFTSSEYQHAPGSRWPRFDLSPRIVPPPEIVVRWSTADPDARAKARARYQLMSPTPVADRTWRYVLGDTSVANVRALLNDPDVEDTGGIDRGTASVGTTRESVFTRWARKASSDGHARLAGLLRSSNAAAMVLTAFFLAPILGLGALVVIRITATANPPPGQATLLAAVVLAGLTLAGLLRDPIEARLPDVSVLPAVLGAWGVAACVSAARGRRRWQGAVGLGVGLSLGLVTTLAAAEVGRFDRAVDESALLDGAGAAWTRARRVTTQLSSASPLTTWESQGDERRELKALTRYLASCTQPEDFVLVTWFEPEVYYYSDRRFAAGLAFFHSGFFTSTAFQDLALTRLRRQTVPVVLVERGRYESFFERSYPGLAEHFRTRFTWSREFVSPDGGRYVVLTDSSRAPVGRYQPLDLPCFRPS